MPEVPVQPSLALIVVNFASSELLRTNLVAVSGQLAGAHVVVVDNLSTADEREAVRALCTARDWTGVFPDTNTGFGGGSNLGATAAIDAGADTLLFLNPDATIDAASVRLLQEALTDDPMTLAAPRIVRPDGAVWSAGVDLDLDLGDMRSWRRRGEAPHARTMPWLSGACLMVRTTLWQRIGGFDEDYFLYWEDVDLSASAVRAGGRLRLIDAATAIHDEGGTHVERGRPEAKSSLYYYYNIRNRAVFARKHLDADDQARWQRGARPAAWQILLRGGRRQFAHPVRPLRAAWRGLRDGRRGAVGPAAQI